MSRNSNPEENLEVFDFLLRGRGANMDYMDHSDISKGEISQ